MLPFMASMAVKTKEVVTRMMIVVKVGRVGSGRLHSLVRIVQRDEKIR